MALIDWDQALYGVNIEQFDKDHQKILDFINQLHQAMLQGKGKDILQAILLELKSYTQYHFGLEEKEMIRVSFPEYQSHRQQHRQLIEQLQELIEMHQQDKREVTIETFKFLKEWLFNHIQVVDKKYVPYLKA